MTSSQIPVACDALQERERVGAFNERSNGELEDRGGEKTARERNGARPETRRRNRGDLKITSGLAIRNVSTDIRANSGFYEDNFKTWNVNRGWFYPSIVNFI